ncbi:hypothetical protein [Thermoflexus sp.]|uniref:hypothetical protein n=1 Tax=Thermoflexus sp. TaxID=1969742 RepID=UPI002ADE4ED5|nr:hypothetical protein [Thermoflexus sp.]
MLRSRGFRWDPRERRWTLEVEAEKLADEMGAADLPAGLAILTRRQEAAAARAMELAREVARGLPGSVLVFAGEDVELWK